MASDGGLIRAVVAAGVRDERVLEACRRVSREAFVSSEFTDDAQLDVPVPISHGQVTSQPSLVARMVEALGLKGEEHVLEVGSGYGYQTALLAHLAATVMGIERWEDMVSRARDNLASQGIGNALVVTGDGTQGWPERAPYDAVILSAAFPEVPAPLTEQLRQGGRLVQPIGSGGGESVLLFERTASGVVSRDEVSPARFVPLYGRYGYAED